MVATCVIYVILHVGASEEANCIFRCLTKLHINVFWYIKNNEKYFHCASLIEIIGYVENSLHTHSIMKVITHHKQTHKHTPNTHTKNHRLGTLQRLCPVSQWVDQQRSQLMAPLLPMDSWKAPAIWCASAMTGSLVWGAKARQIKK